MASKALKHFFDQVKKVKDCTERFFGNPTSGGRILLTDKRKDPENGLRIDAGEAFNGPNGGKLRNVYLQVNSKAKSQVLLNWVKKQRNKTHSNLARDALDLKARDQTAELARVIESLETQAKSNLLTGKNAG
ncbi:hypothetical protein N7462_004507 [Penicillium macrosclerotiorum]|uniref:uncharacterized protein n=1 Tax=Penicillium macrosclerotiorum TaxID=303699 RepID=UPI00254891ED|nr:uncharacterized protein N7462_004507 [Penicillium macrosclerotiorum]KAJ5690115.1 hypothetical protein N7462_004507 [Penicillium macrosclerotiorum]